VLHCPSYPESSSAFLLFAIATLLNSLGWSLLTRIRYPISTLKYSHLRLKFAAIALANTVEGQTFALTKIYLQEVIHKGKLPPIQ